MTDHPFAGLPERGPKQVTDRNLDRWVHQAQGRTGIAVGRVGWIVASSVVVGVLQRVLHTDNQPRFVLKGGTYLEHRLGLTTRATKDVDALFRGDFNDLLVTLDACLKQPWGPIEFRRTAPVPIAKVPRRTKPVRFDIQLLVRGAVWRKVPVEVSPDEGSAGADVELLAAPPLSHFALPDPGLVAGIVVDYQVAQKLHACTDPHQPPDRKNDRSRDVVDLLLLRREIYPDGTDLAQLRAACEDIFASRALEAPAAGFTPRGWPPVVTAHPHWVDDYAGEAAQAGLGPDLDASVASVNEWIEQISTA